MIKLSFLENPVINISSLPDDKQAMDITTSAVIKNSQIPNSTIFYQIIEYLSKNKYQYNWEMEGIEICIKSYATLSYTENITLARQILLAKNKLKLYTIMRNICYSILLKSNTIIPTNILKELAFSGNCRIYKKSIIYQLPNYPQTISKEDSLLKEFFFYKELVNNEQDNITYLVSQYKFK